MSKNIVYEVRCEQCRTSFAPETRRCVHCGAPLAKGRRVISTPAGLDPVRPPQEAAEEEDELLARGPKTAIWVVIALVTAVASILRTCVE